MTMCAEASDIVASRAISVRNVIMAMTVTVFDAYAGFLTRSSGVEQKSI